MAEPGPNLNVLEMAPQEYAPSFMHAGEELFQLQLEQLRHDRNFHADVWALPIPARLAHYCIHFSKYVGQIAEANALSWEETLQPIVDFAVVGLSASNALNIDLSSSELFQGCTEYPTVDMFVKGVYTSTRRRRTSTTDILSEMSIIVGKFARSTDKLQHAEATFGNEILHKIVPKIVYFSLSKTADFEISISNGIQHRLREVESRSIFTSHL